DGGTASTQTITNFTFLSIPSESLTVTSTNTVVISWSSAITGYVLQQNSDLSTANWVNVASPDTIVNGLHQVVVPLGSANEFYRLKLQ
ncbi:MAG: hypothetical protein ACREFE_19635, partial [Limisphaerales bacterium]